MKIGVEAFYQRISELLSIIVDPETIFMKNSLNKEFNETSVLNLISVLANRLNKNIDIAQYKYMIIYLYSTEVQKSMI